MNNLQVATVSLVTQHIYNDICLAQMIVNLQLIIIDQLEPSSLSPIQVWLREDVLQALVVRIDVYHIPMQIMLPRPQC
jgi:hypothetical protein